MTLMLQNISFLPKCLKITSDRCSNCSKLCSEVLGDIRWSCSHTHVGHWIQLNALKKCILALRSQSLVSLRLTMLSKAEKNLIQCLQTQSIFISDLVNIIAQNFRDYPFKLYRRPRLCFHKDILSGHSSFLFLCDDCLTLISVDNSILRGGGLQNQAI